MYNVSWWKSNFEVHLLPGAVTTTQVIVANDEEVICVNGWTRSNEFLPPSRFDIVLQMFMCTVFLHSLRYISYNITFYFSKCVPIENVLTGWLLACELADKPVLMITTLSLASLSSPHVSYAIFSSGRTPLLYRTGNGFFEWKSLYPDTTFWYSGSLSVLALRKEKSIAKNILSFASKQYLCF